MRRVIMLVAGLCLYSQIFSQGIAIEEPVKMLALGDSYTIGASVAVEERWPHQFVAALNDMGIEAGTPDYIAITGWTTQNLLGGIDRQLDTTKAYNLVSILIGVNNQYQGQPIESYEPDLRKIIEQALEVVTHDTGKVFMVSIPDYAYTPFGNGDAVITAGINAYNDINYRVSMEYGLTYVNITAISRRGLGEPSLVAADGLHPSGAQYALWVEAILSWLENNPSLDVGSSSSGHEVSSEALRIYPNPAVNAIRIETGVPVKSLRIIDQTGKHLSEHNVMDDAVELDFSGYSPGLYFLEGTTNGIKRVVPFVLTGAY